MNYPKPVGAYSATRRTNDMLFISGQIPLDPATNTMIQGDIKAQTKRVLESIGAILEENGLNFSNVIKTTVLLADIDDFAAMNEIYAQFFKAPYPARSAFAVKAIPKGALVEIEVIASFEAVFPGIA